VLARSSLRFGVLKGVLCGAIATLRETVTVWEVASLVDMLEVVRVAVLTSSVMSR